MMPQIHSSAPLKSTTEVVLFVLSAHPSVETLYVNASKRHVDIALFHLKNNWEISEIIGPELLELRKRVESNE